MPKFSGYRRVEGMRDILATLQNISAKQKTILTVTQEEYDAIDPKDPNTIYLIKEDDQNP